MLSDHELTVLMMCRHGMDDSVLKDLNKASSLWQTAVVNLEFLGLISRAGIRWHTTEYGDKHIEKLKKVRL